MRDIIVQTPENVTLVGAGQASKAVFHAALAFAPFLVAADGGAELVLNCGKTPEKVIGDFDSIDRAILARIPENRRFHRPDQNSTDFEKCLGAIRAPLILGVGFLGRRLDHQLAAFNALVRHPARACVLIGAHDLVFHLSGPLDLELEPGSRLSLFALAPCRGTSRGLQWPIDGLQFAPDGQTGTSNRVTDGPVHLASDGAGMLVILPSAALGAVVRGLGAGRAGGGGGIDGP